MEVQGRAGEAVWERGVERHEAGEHLSGPTGLGGRAGVREGPEGALARWS